MKALFSYKPSEDRYLPCEEAGLKFEERQILSVFNQEDPEYWQATHGGENSNDVGLIPSAKMRERYFSALRCAIVFLSIIMIHYK